MRICIFFLLIIFFRVDAMITNEIEWLEKNSMLYSAKELAKIYSGKKIQWQHPYAVPEPKEVISLASNWFTAYPLSIITPENQSVLEFLGSEELWKVLEEIGIQAIHTGPMKISGGLQNKKRTPSVDGGFDRIGFEIDPQFGTMKEYIEMTKVAQKHGGIIIGDLVPGHTGIGPDFILALKNYKDYPGIYHMVEINPKDWDLLPEVPQGTLSENLTLTEVQNLKKKGYIVGELERVISYSPGVNETCWNSTDLIEGVDGIKRRWVYLHYFKAGQPTMNWLDPTFAANRIISGDIILSLHILKSKILRLDANGFLGVESLPNMKKAWSEGHPLSVGSSDEISQMIRKFGGFSFQELNLGVLSLEAFIENGTDLSYDFLTRPAYINALLHQNTDLLKIAYQLIKKHHIQSYSFIHALQNHDEFNYELNYLKEMPETPFSYCNQNCCGFDLRKEIQKKDYFLLTEKYKYNLGSENGPCSTLIGLIAASLNIPDVFKMTDKEKEKIKKAHLLLAFYNCMQPGVFAISGWDLVGALPLQPAQIKDRMEDKDARWISRGSYDLLRGICKSKSASNIPQAKFLYGPINRQLKDPKSFVSQLRILLKVRMTSNLDTAEFIDSLPSQNPSVLYLLHKLPSTDNLELTAINFGQKKVQEKIRIRGTLNTSAINLVTRKSEKKDFSSETLDIELDALSGKAIQFQPKAFPAPISDPP